jgi:hypothetical protein
VLVLVVLWAAKPLETLLAGLVLVVRQQEPLAPQVLGLGLLGVRWLAVC